MSVCISSGIRLAATNAASKSRLISSRSICTSVSLHGKWKKGEFVIWKHWKGDRSNDIVRIPDWSYADERPMPPGINMNVNMELQRQICKRIILLRKEMAVAKETEHSSTEKSI